MEKKTGNQKTHGNGEDVRFFWLYGSSSKQSFVNHPSKFLSIMLYEPVHEISNKVTF